MIQPKHKGMRHIALRVKNINVMMDFYQSVLGYKIEWQPDKHSCYLTSGSDNLALHQITKEEELPSFSQLDHFGIFVKSLEEVGAWHEYLVHKNIKTIDKPKQHRDGSCSFYLHDPENNKVQIIYYPPADTKHSK